MNLKKKVRDSTNNLIESTAEIRVTKEGGRQTITYEDILKIKEMNKKDHMVFDFRKLIKVDPALGDAIVTSPDESFQTMSETLLDKFEALKQPFTVRVRNVFLKDQQIHINQIRADHVGKLVVLEGVIKRKTGVTTVTYQVVFECNRCAHLEYTLQEEGEPIVQPTKCGCGAKKSFKQISTNTYDWYAFLMEEPPESLEGWSRPSSIKVKCKKDLAEPKIERHILEGMRVEVIGIVREAAVYSQRGKMTTNTLYVEANYVRPLGETFEDIKYTEEEIGKFKEIAEKEDWLDFFRHKIFKYIYGYDEELKAVVLQMFGGTRETKPAPKRGNLHILLIGDAGLSKSTILKAAKKFHPKALMASGPSTTGTGLTAAVIRDESLGGGYVCEAGAMVLANNGLLAIDELDKVPQEQIKSLHTPMADEFVSVNKANISTTLPAQTAILAAANPKDSSFSAYASLQSQIPLSSTIQDRFDFIFPLLSSKLTMEDQQKIGNIVVSSPKAEKNPEYSEEIIKKYIAYAKKNIHPKISTGIRDYLVAQYVKALKTAEEKYNTAGVMRVTPRFVDKLRRVSSAVARSRLHEQVTLEDAAVAYELSIYAAKQLGIDPEDPESISTYSVEGVEVHTVKKGDLKSRIRELIKERTKEGGLMSWDEIKVIMEDEKFNVDDAEEMVEKLRQVGDITMAKQNHYRDSGL